MTAKTDFTHADILRAFADGKKVQAFIIGHPDRGWTSCDLYRYATTHDAPDMRFRVAPEPKPDIVSYDYVRPNQGLTLECVRGLKSNSDEIVKLTISGETGKLSVEVVEDES